MSFTLENFPFPASFCCLFVFLFNMTDPTTTADSWSNHYKNHHSSDDINQKISSILDICRHGSSNDDCFKNMIENPGLALLAVNGFNDLHLLHQVHVLSPSIVFPEEKVLALAGSNSTAECFKLLKTSLFYVHEVGVPRWSALKGAETKKKWKPSPKL